MVLSQCEDEISGCASSVGAAFALVLLATSTSGPGLSEIRGSGYQSGCRQTSCHLVILDVQRGGPSTGLPTKSEQTDLLQAL